MKLLNLATAILLLLCSLSPASGQNAKRYEATWESINSRPIPGWFDEAKFGIFIHWGVYSVPSWAPVPKDGKVTGSAPYAEWYWRKLEKREGPTWEFHKRVYGADFNYKDFVHSFKAEMFDPDLWANLFHQSGARYVVLTSKHHDGFTLWPSAQSPGWNSGEVGPKRDLIGDLSKAVRNRGLKMGLYYSLYEWYHPLYRMDVKSYVDEHMLPQMKDIVNRYQPSILWTDGEWDHPSATWRSTEFLQWLFNQASNRDEVVVNDRWGKETRNKSGSFFTTEYGSVHFGRDEQIDTRHKWEENRGMGTSYGYNRNETYADYQTSTALIHMLIDKVSKGGNFLLDIGPTADGRVPVIMQQRLADIGQWLKTNGEAIYGTTQWREAGEGEHIRYTRKGQDVYAIALKWPGRELTLNAPKTNRNTTVALLGSSANLKWKADSGKLSIEVPPVSPDEAIRHAYVFKLTNVE